MNDFSLNLKHAGCDAERVSEICSLYENGELTAVVKRLRRHRADLMDKLHHTQEEVDCLDSLIRKINKTQNI